MEERVQNFEQRFSWRTDNNSAILLVRRKKEKTKQEVKK
jgi:hypothetical protein